MRSPYITMSFMALPVIPALKLTQKVRNHEAYSHIIIVHAAVNR